MTIVKVCGITERTHALIAAEAGADFIGFVFAPSRRRITPDTGREIATVLRSQNPHVQLVGVFVNMPATEVNQIADFCHLDWVQLSGNEPWEYLETINKRVIRVIGVKEQQTSDNIISQIMAGHGLLQEDPVWLLDRHVEGSFGGTGQSFNWDVARDVARIYTIILAGGLSSDNVANAIAAVKPWGVDVSSGVETSHVKDVSKIRSFIQAVRKADGR